MNKSKIFELKIEEDDDISGIDSISLVDEPAIEVNWVAFNKEKEHEFHIPDGEDDVYVERLLKKAQLESDLLEDGWVIDKIYEVGKEDFTAPNDDSYEDTDYWRVRYKYGLSQNIKESSIIPTTRQFCRQLVSNDYVWRVEDINLEVNSFGQSAKLWRGGYNCRHRWMKILYKRDGDIINKATVNKNKIGTETGVSIGLTPEWVQPNTVTNKTAANPKPSTVRNLGLSKELFEGKPKVSIDYDGTLSTPEGEDLYKELVAQGNDVYIVTKRNEMEGGPILDKAKQLRIPQNNVIFTNGKDKSGILKQLGISKHYDNSPEVIDEIKKNAPDVEAIKFAYDVSGIGGYVDPGIKKKKKMSEDFSYLYPKTNMSKMYFAQDEEKRIVLGPAMIPDMKIFRRDSKGNPYHVYFTEDTIKMIAEKYMKNKYIDNNDQMHDGKAVSDVYVIESWIKEDEHDKSIKYGFGDLPIGTWFVAMKVKNDEIWNKIKNHELNGFSVSGFFEEVAAFSKEDMFLYKVSQVLKNIKE